MSDNPSPYSTFTPLQELGEEIAARGADGPARHSRVKLGLGGLLAVGLIAISPAGAAVGNAIDDLIGSEPTASSLYLGDLPAGHNLTEMQKNYFDARLRLSQVVGGGTTPLGTPFQMVVLEEASSPVFGSSAFVAFDTEQTAFRSVDTGIGPTVSKGFDDAAVPIYPTIYRGPIEEGDTPTPVIIGVAPADVASVEVTYRGSEGQRANAPVTTAQVTTGILEANDDAASILEGSDNGSGASDSLQPPRTYRPVRRPSYSNDPYAFFVGFLPPDLDRAEPRARQVDLDFSEIEVAAFDSAGRILYSMRMDGRFSGDPGILSFG